MVPIILEKQLLPGKLEFAIPHLIETRIDMSPLEANPRLISSRSLILN